MKTGQALDWTATKHVQKPPGQKDKWISMNDQINRQTGKWLEHGWRDGKPKERMINIKISSTQASESHTGKWKISNRQFVISYLNLLSMSKCI